MTVFRREPEARDPVSAGRLEPSRAGAPETRIAPGSKIDGKILGATPVAVEGEFRGSIDVDAAVVVGAGGVVDGEIYGRAVQVSGRVKGDVHAAERVELVASGTIEGDIAAPRVVIAEGAFFEGRVEMKPAGT